MAVLAKLRRQNPGNAGFKNEWEELLKTYFKSLEAQEDDQQETEKPEPSTDSEQDAVELEDKILQSDIVHLQ